MGRSASTPGRPDIEPVPQFFGNDRKTWTTGANSAPPEPDVGTPGRAISACVGRLWISWRVMLRTLPVPAYSLAALTTAALLLSACSADEGGTPTKNMPNAGATTTGGTAGTPATTGGQAGTATGGSNGGAGGSSTTGGATSNAGATTTGGTAGAGGATGGAATGGSTAQCIVCDGRRGDCRHRWQRRLERGLGWSRRGRERRNRGRCGKRLRGGMHRYAPVR